jgi:hypothetical protein
MVSPRIPSGEWIAGVARPRSCARPGAVGATLAALHADAPWWIFDRAA